MKSQSESWASFLPNAFLLVIGFILTTVIGAGLTNYYQDRASRQTLILNAAQSDFDETKGFFMSVSSLMDQRAFRMRQLSEALSKDPADNSLLADRINSYRIPFNQWNSTLNENLSLYDYYFGSSDSPDENPGCPFPGNQNSGILNLSCIQQGFINANSKLDQLESDNGTKKQDYNSEAAQYNATIDTLTKEIFHLDRIMLDKTKFKQQSYQDNLESGNPSGIDGVIHPNLRDKPMFDWLNSLSTLVIALFTGTLWWSTHKLWIASQDQIRAATGAERPWLFPVATKIPPRGGKVEANNQWWISVTVKNVGRMPALVQECKVRIAEKSTLPLIPDYSEATNIGGPYSIEAQGQFETRPIGPGKPSEDQLVFYGKIKYAELNGKVHCVRFAFEVWKLGMDSLYYENDAYQKFD